MKTLVVGCGSIGKRHLANLKKLGIEEVVACDSNLERVMEVSSQYGIKRYFTDYREAIEQIKNMTAAVICTPSSLHIEPALFLAEKGVHLLIEKPLSHTMDGITELIQQMETKGLIGMMGMCYRFHPGLLMMKNLLVQQAIGKIHAVRCAGGYYLPEWHPVADYRVEYTARRELGGGVLLTSIIHVVDYIRWLFGEIEEVVCFIDRVSELDIDTEDITLCMFRLDNGIYVQVYNDFLQRNREHRIDIIGKKGTIRWEAAENCVQLFLGEPEGWITRKYDFDVNEMYLAEMEAFLRYIEQGRRPEADLREGGKDLQIIIACQEADRQRKAVKVSNEM